MHVGTCPLGGPSPFLGTKIILVLVGFALLQNRESVRKLEMVLGTAWRFSGRCWGRSSSG